MATTSITSKRLIIIMKTHWFYVNEIYECIDKNILSLPYGESSTVLWSTDVSAGFAWNLIKTVLIRDTLNSKLKRECLVWSRGFPLLVETNLEMWALEWNSCWHQLCSTSGPSIWYRRATCVLPVWSDPRDLHKYRQKTNGISWIISNILKFICRHLLSH